MNFQKIFTAAAGLTLLAGLAYHQGNHERQSAEDDSMLVGTAIETPVQSESPQEAAPETALNDQPECSTEQSVPVPNAESADPCTAEEIIEDPSVELAEGLKG